MDKALKDLLAGLIFIAFGVAFGATAWTYQLGTALRMGPGYFPLVLAGLLVFLGICVVVAGLLAGEGDAIGPIPWRAIVLVLGAVIFFGLTVRRLGLAPAVFVAILLSAFSSERTGILSALAMAALLTLACIGIFVYALGLRLPLLGPWLSF